MSVSVRLESRHSPRMGKHFHSCSPHERSDMRERRLRRAAAPDIAPLIQATFPAKAGNPVRRGLSVLTAASGILGRPVKPDDDVRRWGTLPAPLLALRPAAEFV